MRLNRDQMIRELKKKKGVENVVSTLGTVSKSSKKRLEELEIRGRMGTIQTIVMS